MTNRVIIVVATVLSFLGVIYSSAFADHVVGPNSAHINQFVVFPPVAGNAEILGTQIPIGKAGHVLIVNVTVQDNGYGYKRQRFYFFPTVNGFTMPGGGVSYLNDDSKNGFGSASGTWFIDLDAYGLSTSPLNIDVVGGTVYYYKDDASRSATVTISAILKQK